MHAAEPAPAPAPTGGLTVSNEIAAAERVAAPAPAVQIGQGRADRTGPRARKLRPSGVDNPLQELIQRRLTERGWSYGQVARRGNLPRSTVYYLATTPTQLRPPRPATLARLARGLELPADFVCAAAVAGLQPYGERRQNPEDPEDPDLALLTARLKQLRPQDRRHVTALVDSLLQHAAEEPELPTPNQPVPEPSRWAAPRFPDS